MSNLDKFLKGLARMDHPKSDEILKKEFASIRDNLLSTNDYNILESNLERLKEISHRVHKETIDLIKTIIAKLENEDITYASNKSAIYGDYWNRRDNAYLIIRCLEILDRIRYYDINSILGIYINYSIHENTGIRNRVTECIDSLASYNINLVYGSKHNSACGTYAQNGVLKVVEKFDANDKKKYFSSIIFICEKLLSSTVTDASFSYSKVTWSTAPIQPDKYFSEIRDRCLNLLEELYDLSDSVNQKLSVINTMYSVIRTPDRGEYKEELIDLIFTNLSRVLSFYLKLLDTESLQIIQKIEHNSYWIFKKNRSNEKIKDSALSVKDKIDRNDEYKIYKALIGYEGIYDDWDIAKGKSRSYEKEREYRNDKALEFAKSINENNYESWAERITLYSETKSDDLATFPYFGQFLENFAYHSPDLCKKLITEHPDKLDRFLVAILCGLWSANKKDTKLLMSNWINEKKYIFHCARFFQCSNELDEDIFNEILNIVLKNDNTTILNQIISSLILYVESHSEYVFQNTIKAIEKLTTLNNTDWVNAIWFREKKNTFLGSLDNKQTDIILQNLLYVNKVDYQVEDILLHISLNHPDRIIQFFGDRLAYEKNNELNSKYDAIPYEFHNLNEGLAKIPERAVDIVSEWYSGSYELFIYEGANLLKNIFPEFPSSFENKLLELVNTGDLRNLEIVLSVLRNYEGETFLHNICKNIIDKSPDEEYWREVACILENTGVVSGQYGFANAFKEKKKQIENWSHDDSDKVKKFADHYIKGIEKRIEFETKRADQNIELRKHQYGDDE